MALMRGYVRHGTDNPSFLDVSFVPGTEESGNPFHPMRESELRISGQKSCTILHFGTDRYALLERARTLVQMGYEVLNSSNGFEAIQLACLDVVDAVVLDQQGNRAEVEIIVKEVKRSRPQVPTILLLESAAPKASTPQFQTVADAKVMQRNDVNMLVATLKSLLAKNSSEPETLPD